MSGPHLTTEELPQDMKVVLIVLGQLASPITHRGGGLNQSELCQRRHAIVETNFLHNLAVEHLQYSGAGEMHLERLDVTASAARLMQRILKQHTRCGNFVDDCEIDILTPKVREPTTDDSLIAIFFAHLNILLIGFVEIIENR
jgi:hypothetical protein